MSRIISLVLIDAFLDVSTLGLAFDGQAIFWMAIGMMIASKERLYHP